MTKEEIIREIFESNDDPYTIKGSESIYNRLVEIGAIREWKPIEEYKPEMGVDVIVLTASGYMDFALYSEGRFRDSWGDKLIPVKFMLLPKPPTE